MALAKEFNIGYSDTQTMSVPERKRMIYLMMEYHRLEMQERNKIEQR